MATIIGTPDDDIRLGNPEADEIAGLGGRDTLKGKGGDDIMVGGDQNDILKGGAGDDDLYGGADDDRLIGGDGFDFLDGGDGSDEYRITEKDGEIADDLRDSGDFGTDTLDAKRVAVALLDTDFDANKGIEAILGNANTGTTLQSEQLDVSPQPVTWDFTTITLTDILALVGAGAADAITGSTDDDLIKGVAGADVLNGGAGNDVLKGGGGNDVLNGGAGDDRLVGGKGDDQLIYDAADTEKVYGRAGTDTLVVEGADVALGITATSGVLYQGIEIIDLTGSGANSLTLDKGSLKALSEDTNTLRVLGGADDAVITSGGEWILSLPTTHGAFTFDVYVSGGLTLEVQQGMDVMGITPPPALLMLRTLDLMANQPGTDVFVLDDTSDPAKVNTTSGALYYDADGAGGAGAVQFAVIATDVDGLSWEDFEVM